MEWSREKKATRLTPNGFSRQRFKFWKVTVSSEKRPFLFLSLYQTCFRVRQRGEHRLELTASLLGGGGPPCTCT